MMSKTVYLHDILSLVNPNVADVIDDILQDASYVVLKSGKYFGKRSDKPNPQLTQFQKSHGEDWVIPYSKYDPLEECIWEASRFGNLKGVVWTMKK